MTSLAFGMYFRLVLTCRRFATVPFRASLVVPDCVLYHSCDYVAPDTDGLPCRAGAPPIESASAARYTGRCAAPRGTGGGKYGGMPQLCEPAP